MTRALVLAFAVLPALGATVARAEVTDSAKNGFTSRNTVNVRASSDRVFRALTQDVGYWWHPDHTFSGDAKNLSLEAKPGGCFCEKLGTGGGVRHLEVVFVEPGKRLRLRGGLGPLQAMAVQGSLTWELDDSAEATTVSLTYAVGGYHPEGLDTLATAVDGVLSLQLDRLERFIETGAP